MSTRADFSSGYDPRQVSCRVLCFALGIIALALYTLFSMAQLPDPVSASQVFSSILFVLQQFRFLQPLRPVHLL